MATTHSTTEHSHHTHFIWIASEVPTDSKSSRSVKPQFNLNPLQPVRRWLDGMEVCDPKMARTIASIIPAQCPFERTVKFAGRTVLHIPPLCKLNPFYEELVGLRFRALCYLADQCGEDISSYC